MKKIVLLICVFLLWCMVSTTSAGSVYNWVGNPNPSFCNPQAWDGGGVPGPDDMVFIDPPPYQGPVVDCNAGIDQMFGPTAYSDADQVMTFESGDFEVDVWKLAQTGTGKATINIRGDSNVTAAAGNGYEFGGIHGPQSGDLEINITDDATFTVKSAERGIHLGTHAGTTTVWNISGNARIKSYGKHGIQLADEGTVIVNISENARISHSKWRNCDSSDGYVEIHMTGGEISGGYLSIYDDGSGIFDFSGGTVEVDGLLFGGGGENSWCEYNLSGNADVSAWIEVRLSYKGPTPSTLNISGDAKLQTDDVRLGCAANSVSTLNMTGGWTKAWVAIHAPQHKDGRAEINLEGGTIECAEFTHAVPEGDFDENAVVGWEDLAMFAADWLIICEDYTQQCPATDLNRSRTVDLGDYARFASHWGESSSDNWHMDVCGGTMIIEGDVTARIQADIAAGNITACDGQPGYSIVVDYDNINPGKTTLRVEPSPVPGQSEQ